MVGSLGESATRFFDAFVDAFASFDGNVIAERYAAPYLALHVDGTTTCFPTQDAIGRYFQAVVDAYRADGCCACRYEDLEVMRLGKASALATVTWELLRRDGSVLSRWRESYTLAHPAGRMQVVASVDHAE